MTEEWLRVLLSYVATDGLPPHVATPADDSLGGSQRRSGGADIEVENRLIVIVYLLSLARVVVNDVSNLLLLAIDLARDVPVVSVKGRLGPMED